MSPSGSPAYYEIRVEGLLDRHWEAWFGGLQFTSDGAQTVISGRLPDQPALHGLLGMFTLIAWGRVAIEQERGPTGSTKTGSR